MHFRDAQSRGQNPNYCEGFVTLAPGSFVESTIARKVLVSAVGIEPTTY